MESFGICGKEDKLTTQPEIQTAQDFIRSQHLALTSERAEYFL